MTTHDDVFKAFGRIGLIYSNLDFFVTTIINLLITDNYRVATAITSGITSLSAKVQLADELRQASDLPEHVNKPLEEFLKQVDKVRKRRNRFLHDLWSISDDLLSDGKIERKNVSKGLDNHSSEIVSIADLEAFGDGLATLVHKGIDILALIQSDYRNFTGLGLKVKSGA